MSPDFFVRELLALGADAVHGRAFRPALRRRDVDPSGILTAEDKPRLVATALEAAGVGADRCVAFGDSMSDAPLFRALSAPSPSTPMPTCSTWPAWQPETILWVAYRASVDRCSPEASAGPGRCRPWRWPGRGRSGQSPIGMLARRAS